MLDEHAEKALERAQERPVHHVGAPRRAILGHVGHVKELGLVEIELDRRHLPLAAQGVLDLEVDLGAVEGAAPLVEVVGQLLDLQRLAQRLRGLRPARRLANRLFLRLRGQVGLDIVKAKGVPEVQREAQRAQDLGLDLLGRADNVRIVLRKATAIRAERLSARSAEQPQFRQRRQVR